MNAMSTVNFDIQQSTEFCSKHQVNHVVYRGRSICKQCSFELLDRGQKEHHHAVNTMVRDKHFAGAKLPLRHAQSGFGNYVVSNDGQRNAKAQCMSFAKDFMGGVIRNLIMVGRTGTGKTHLSSAVALNVLDKRKSARYITSEDMANEIANAWKRTDDSEANAIYRFTDYDLLILDEYGLHDRHENRLQLVHKVLYSRYDEGKATMLISNFTLDELKKDLGDRLWSRFQHDGLTLVECNWGDQRMMQGESV
ncbi:MAG: DNA replication protein DnaC [Acinetobacter bereziniae]|uniref:DNA replication protein DnaC n=1 Tax=Acinetobacter bereziniae TaxID=106648 RepID=A0A833PD29_ACIBZ|nr:MAG: DNA replication protein DnaC [Acinetobacter bereziniae]